MRVVWLLCSSHLWPTVAVNCNGNANWLGLLGGNAARLVCSLSFYLWPAVAASASVTSFIFVISVVVSIVDYCFYFEKKIILNLAAA